MANNYRYVPLLVSDYIDDTSLKMKCDGLIVNSKLFSTFNDVTYTLHELNSIVKKIKDNKKKALLNLNRIIPENEITKFKDILLNVINKFDYIIYSDLAVLSILSGSYYDKLIYDAKTLICNKEELEVFETDAFISQALSINEIKDFTDSDKMFCLDAFGYLEMMYSRRPLLSLVMPRGKAKTNTLYDLKEETRSNSYKIYEVKRNKTNYGTFIYNEGIYVLIKELKDIINNVKIIRINSMFLTNIIDKVVGIYHKYLVDYERDDLDNYKEEYYYERIMSILENNHLKATRGFLDQESVLLKENTDE